MLPHLRPVVADTCSSVLDVALFEITYGQMLSIVNIPVEVTNAGIVLAFNLNSRLGNANALQFANS